MERITRISQPFIERDARGKQRWRVVFWVETTDGTPGRRARTFSNEPDMARWLKAAQASALAERGPTTIGDGVSLFCKAYTDAGRWDPKTLQRNQLDLALFAQPESTPLRDVTHAFVLAFLARLREKPIGTQAKRFAPAVALCKWLWREGHIGADPFAKVGPLDKPWTGKRAKRELELTRDERKPQLSSQAAGWRYIEAALTLADPAERVGALLPLLVGIRSGEVRFLLVKDVDLTTGEIWLRGAHLKTEKASGRADLPAMLRNDLAKLCDKRFPNDLLLPSRTGAAHYPDWLSDISVKVCELAGLPRITPHGLRRSHATWGLNSGRRARDIAAEFGHGDSGQLVTSVYANVPERRAAVLPLRGPAVP